MSSGIIHQQSFSDRSRFQDAIEILQTLTIDIVEETQVRIRLAEIALAFYKSLSTHELLTHQVELCDCISESKVYPMAIKTERSTAHLTASLSDTVNGIECVLTVALNVLRELVVRGRQTQTDQVQRCCERNLAVITMLLDFTLRLCDMIDSSTPSHLQSSSSKSSPLRVDGTEKLSKMEKILMSVCELGWTNALIPSVMEGISEHRYNVPSVIWNQMSVMLEKMLLNVKVFDNNVMPMKTVLHLLREIMFALMITKDLRWATYVRAILQECPVTYASEIDQCVQTFMQQHLSILPYFCDAVQRSLDDGLPLGESASSSNFPHFFAIRTGWKDIVLLLHVLHASTPILDTGCTRLYNKHDSRKSDIVEQTLLRLLQHEWESAKSEELASNGAVNESTDVYVRYSSTVCKIVTFGNPLKDEEKWKSAILTRLALRWLDGRVHLDENQKDSLCNDDNLIVATSTLTALFEKSTNFQPELFTCILEGILQECRSSCTAHSTRKIKAEISNNFGDPIGSQYAIALKMVIERSSSSPGTMNALLPQIPVIQNWLTDSQLFSINIAMAQSYFIWLLSPTAISTEYYNFVQSFLERLFHTNIYTQQKSAVRIYCFWIQEQLMLPAQSRLRLSRQCFQDVIEQLRRSVDQLGTARCICFLHLLSTFDQYTAMTRLTNSDLQPCSKGHDNQEARKNGNDWMVLALYDFVREFLCKYIDMRSLSWIKNATNDMDRAEAIDESVHTTSMEFHPILDRYMSFTHAINFTQVDKVLRCLDTSKEIDLFLPVSNAIGLGHTFYALFKCMTLIEKLSSETPKRYEEHPFGRFTESITLAIVKFVFDFDRLSVWITTGIQEVEGGTDEDTQEQSTVDSSSHVPHGPFCSSSHTSSSGRPKVLWKYVARASLAMGLCHIVLELVLSHLELNNRGASKWEQKLWQLIDFMSSLERMSSALHTTADRPDDGKKCSINPLHNAMAKHLPQLIRLLAHALDPEFPISDRNSAGHDQPVASHRSNDMESDRGASRSYVSSDGFTYILNYCCKEIGDHDKSIFIFRSLLTLYGGIAKKIRFQHEKALTSSPKNHKVQPKVIFLSVNPQTITPHFPTWVTQHLEKSSPVSTVLESLKSYEPYLCKILGGLSIHLCRLTSDELDTISSHVRGSNLFFATSLTEDETHQNITSYLALRYFLDLAYLMDFEGVERSQMACAKLVESLLKLTRDSREEKANSTIHLRLACMAYDLLCIHVVYQPNLLHVLLEICFPHVILSISDNSDAMIIQEELLSTIKVNHQRIVGFALVCGIEKCKKLIGRHKKHYQPKVLIEKPGSFKRKLKRLHRSILESSDEESLEYQGDSPSSVKDCDFDDEQVRIPFLRCSTEKMMALQSILKYIGQAQSVQARLLDTASAEIWQQSSQSVIVLIKDLIAIVTGSLIEVDDLDLTNANYLWIVQLFVQSTERNVFSPTKLTRAISVDLSKTIAKLLLTLDGMMRIVKKGTCFIMTAAYHEDESTERLPFLSITTHYIIAAKCWLQEIKSLCDTSDRVLHTKLANTGLQFDLFSSEWIGFLTKWREICKSDAEMHSYLQLLLDRVQPYGLSTTDGGNREISSKFARNRKHWLGTIPILRRRKRRRLRSRHPYIDECLREESGDDAFADLEDFIV